MGLFGSSKKTTVGTQVQRVIDDDQLPDSALTGLTKNLFAEEGEGDQMMEYIKEELVSGIALRGNRMYDYGKKKYVNGLPSSTVRTSQSSKTAFINALQGELGAIQVDYYHFGPLNNLHIGWQVLQDQLGYNSETNQLPNILAQPVYLEDMQVVVTEASLFDLENGSLAQWGAAPNTGKTPDRPDGMFDAEAKNIRQVPFVVDSSALGDYYKIFYAYETMEQVQITSTLPVTPPVVVNVDRKKIVKGTLQVAMPEYDVNADYHQIRFIKDGRAYYRTYKHGSGAYPAVDATFDIPFNNLGTFFPWVYFRFNKTAGNLNTSSQEYKDSVKLCNMLGFEYDDVCDAIHESPDINDVEQAILMMGVPANSSNEMEARYLYDFFHALDSRPETDNTTSSVAELRLAEALKINIPVTGMVIQDKKFKMSLNYRAITRRKINGVIGKIGTNTAGFDMEFAALVGINTNNSPVTKYGAEKSHYYRRQITNSMYEEIRVFGLNVTYYIYGQYTTTADETDDILLIPIDRAITDTYSLPDREKLLSRSLHYVFNSRIVTKLKWYQTGVFRFIMLVVAVIITIYTWGAGSAAISAAYASGGVVAAAIVIAQYLAVMLIGKYAVKKFVQAVGSKNAFIAALIIIAASYFGGFDASTAGNLLQLGSNIAQTGVNAYITDGYNDLLRETTQWEREMREQTKTLDAAQDLLNTSIGISPIVIFGESPSDFYQRTVHSGNIGVAGIEAVGSYVDIMLTLPKLSDTLGETDV